MSAPPPEPSPEPTPGLRAGLAAGPGSDTVGTGDPNVERVEVATYTVPTERPEADGTASWDATTIVLVRAHAGGLVGTGWTYGPLEGCRVVRDALGAVVVGRPALDVPGMSEAMIRRVRNAGRPGVAGYAISAVDTALWDLKARLLGLPSH